MRRDRIVNSSILRAKEYLFVNHCRVVNDLQNNALGGAIDGPPTVVGRFCWMASLVLKRNEVSLHILNV